MDFEQLAAYFIARGIKSVFGIPGSGPSLALLDAMERQGIDFHLTRFEGTGVIMAATTGRLSGRAGLSLSIKGPGLANSIPGLAAAWFEAFPVVHLTEATPHEAPAWQAHKRLDHGALVKGVSKGIVSLTKNNISIDSAFSLAEEEEPGPVVLEFKDDNHSFREQQPVTTPESTDIDGILKLIGPGGQAGLERAVEWLEHSCFQYGSGQGRDR